MAYECVIGFRTFVKDDEFVIRVACQLKAVHFHAVVIILVRSRHFHIYRYQYRHVTVRKLSHPPAREGPPKM